MEEWHFISTYKNKGDKQNYAKCKTNTCVTKIQVKGGEKKQFKIMYF